MHIIDKYTIPTGYLFTTQGSKGPLETLSIGDYGKRYNIKADFLGYHDEIAGVPNVHCMPLSEKWVVTLSTQYGCPMKCTFCDVPNVKWQGNATFDDLKAQLYNAISFFPECRYTERLNIHFARMGDPIFNPTVFEFARWMHTNKRQIAADTGLSIEVLHPVLTTSSPRNLAILEKRLLEWCEIKNEVYHGQAGLQLSINSTSDAQRDVTYQGLQSSLERIAGICDKLHAPVSRKYCLNFAYATGNEIDGDKMRKWFDPAKFMCKITPIHNNTASKANGIETVGGYDSFHPYREPERILKDAGFDVLVFVPSLDEEDGLVTCGNVVLGGSSLKYDEGQIKIHGLKRNK